MRCLQRGPRFLLRRHHRIAASDRLPRTRRAVVIAEVFSITTPTIAYSATTAKTAIEIAAGSTATARLVQISATFDASTPATGMRIELVRYTTTGTGTTYTPLKYNGEAQNRAAVCTAKVNDTVEPGTPTIVEAYYVPNTAGQFWQLPLGRELYIPASSFLGLRITPPSATAINGVFNALIEE